MISRSQANISTTDLQPPYKVESAESTSIPQILGLENHFIFLPFIYALLFESITLNPNKIHKVYDCKVTNRFNEYEYFCKAA